jgi:hypothetical protein
MSLSKNESLVTVCGLYCGKCAIYDGSIGDTAKKLSELLKSHGLTRETMAMIPGVDWYDDFENGLNWCQETVKCGGCRSDMRFNPMCELHKCCVQEKGLDFCFECDQFPCDTVRTFEQQFFPCIDTLQKIKEVGVAEWVRRQG